VGSATGLVFILYNAASIIGCAFGGPIMDYFGRRRGMQSGCLFTLAGAALAAGSQTQEQFKASRFLLGFGVILQTLSAPVYVTEIIPPQWRGRLGGFYNTFYVRSRPYYSFLHRTNNLPVHWLYHWYRCGLWYLFDEWDNRMETS
jgi:MFS family permease